MKIKGGKWNRKRRGRGSMDGNGTAYSLLEYPAEKNFSRIRMGLRRPRASFFCGTSPARIHDPVALHHDGP